MNIYSDFLISMATTALSHDLSTIVAIVISCCSITRVCRFAVDAEIAMAENKSGKDPAADDGGANKESLQELEKDFQRVNVVNSGAQNVDDFFFFLDCVGPCRIDGR